MIARVERWNAAVAPIAGQKLGINARALFRNRGGESALGDLVADAIRAAAKTDVAMQNSGGLRADFPAGEVTKATIYEIMPFDNQIFTMELKGLDVERAIEDALRFGRVTQVSGVRYTFDPDRPEGDRVISVTDATGKPLEPEKIYRVACNDFMATGGDNYDALSGGRNRQNTGILVRQVLEDYVQERSKTGPLEYQSDGRVQRANPKEAGQ
jgi:5'-nucleotidase